MAPLPFPSPSQSPKFSPTDPFLSPSTLPRGCLCPETPSYDPPTCRSSRVSTQNHSSEGVPFPDPGTPPSRGKPLPSVTPKSRPLPAGSHAPPSGSHAPSSSSHAWGLQGEGWDPGIDDPHVPSIAPVTYRRGRGGHEEAKWQQLSQNVVRELMKALKEYGRMSPYFLGLLDGQVTGSDVVPHDIKYLFKCLHSRTEYQLWFATWKRHLQDALLGWSNDPDTAVDNEGNMITLAHVMGEGEWEMPQKQAESLPKPLLKQVAKVAVKAFSTMRPSGPMESYSDIFQGPQENFLLFVERLTVAIEQQEEDEVARERLVTSLAFRRANEVCKQAMLTLPRIPKPTLQDYVEVVTELVPLMTPAKPERPEQRRKTVNAATTETPTCHQDNAAVVPKGRRPSGNSADRPCALCGKRGHWWQACPLRQEFQEFKQIKEGGGGNGRGGGRRSQQKNE